jgi:hypothetical protein
VLEIIAACADREGMRDWVKQKHGIAATNTGNFWLPVVWTARGPLYAEAIALQEDGRFHQPFHLSDRAKQPLYYLAYSLLSAFQATPAVYLIQFALKGSGSSEPPEILFDRLIPFPAEPAIASIGVQEPNLFTCHWLCLTNQPILDLAIKNQPEQGFREVLELKQ